jgi:hypothetical protein
VKVPSVLAVSAFLACSPPARERTSERNPDRTPDRDAPPGRLTDSLALTSGRGTEVWFTIAREATGANHERCIERGLEIRDGAKRVKVPLLYTAAVPTLLDDSTMRAVLWTHCQPGDAYRVNLRTGQPVRERTAGTS